MAVKFKNGQKVRQVVKPIEGEVVGKQLVGDEVQYLVEWSGDDGEKRQRYFGEDEIEATDADA